MCIASSRLLARRFFQGGGLCRAVTVWEFPCGLSRYLTPASLLYPAAAGSGRVGLQTWNVSNWSRFVRKGGFFDPPNGSLSDSSAAPLRVGQPYRKSVSTSFTASNLERFMTLFAVQVRSLRTQVSITEQEVTNDALKQILLAVEEDPFSSKEICNTYVKNVCNSGNLSDAAQLLKVLHSRHIFLSLDAYDGLLASAALTKNFELSSWIFKDLLLAENCLRFRFYMNVAKAFENSNWDALSKFIREVSELTFPRSTAPVNRILLAFAESGQIEKALLVFENMRDLHFKPDVVTYNTVLAILGKAGQVKQMLCKFAAMKESGCVPDLVTYNTLINSSQRMGRIDLCINFLREMGERGIESDLRTYTALIDGFGRLGNVEEALKLFNEMKRRKICPSIYIYRSLIGNIKRMGKLDLATSLREEMSINESKLVSFKDFKRKNRG